MEELEDPDVNAAKEVDGDIGLFSSKATIFSMLAQYIYERPSLISATKHT